MKVDFHGGVMCAKENTRRLSEWEDVAGGRSAGDVGEAGFGMVTAEEAMAVHASVIHVEGGA